MNRRRRRIDSVKAWGVLVVALALGVAVAPVTRAVAAAASPEVEVGRELLRDPGFQRGFRLCEPAPGSRVPYGELRGFEAAPPVWDLDQWSSRFRLAPTDVERDAEGLRAWTNVAKVVRLFRGSGTEVPRMILGVNASAEYGARAREARDPWVHLLVEQIITDPPVLARLRSARFRIEARLLASRLHRTDDYSPERHAAQFQVFLTLQNQDRRSAGFGRLLWFGIPLYDDRHREPPEHKTRDTGGTDMFIFTPPGRVYTSRSAHDGDWVAVDRDLVPLFKEALESAWSKGFLTESRRLEDYAITTINLGWEVPGTFDVAMAVRGLSLWTVPK